MFENPYRRLLLIPIAIGALLFGGLYLSWRSTAARIANAPRDDEGRLLPDLTTATGKLEMARRLEYEKPSESVRITIEIADGPDAAAAASARSLLPRRLQILYQYASSSRWEEAESALHEIEKRAPGSAESRQMHDSWKHDAASLAQAATWQKKYEDAGRLLEEAFKVAGESPDVQLIEQFQRYSLARSRRDAALGKKEEALRWIDEAAAWVVQPMNETELERELSRQGGAAARDMARAARSAGHVTQAMTFLSAARLAFDSERQREESVACEAEIRVLALEVARGIRDGGIRTVPAGAELNFWREASESSEPAVRVEALDGLATIQVRDALAASRAGEFVTADSAFRHAMNQTIPAWWVARADADKTFDVWAGVPASVLEEVKDRSGADPTPEIRKQVLEGLLRDGRWTPPHSCVAAVRAALPDFYARWGASLIAERKFSDAEWMMRGVIREDPKGAPAKACVEALEKGIRGAAAGHDLDGLVQMTAFYVSELGAPAPAFAEEFRSAIKAAAEGLKSTPLQRIFMLSLLCDIFPGTAESEAARVEIFDTGLAFAKAAPAQPDGARQAMDTGLKNLSAASIENATAYHIFVFYEGPEKFFVRINPFRKGTIVLRPGSYVVGVVSPDAEIRPYHASRTVDALTYWDHYVIVREGEQEQRILGGSNATGGYVLLRGVAEAKVTVDVETGIVSPEK